LRKGSIIIHYRRVLKPLLEVKSFILKNAIISGLTQKTGVVFKITNDFKELMDLRHFWWSQQYQCFRKISRTSCI